MFNFSKKKTLCLIQKKDGESFIFLFSGNIIPSSHKTFLKIFNLQWTLKKGMKLLSCILTYFLLLIFEIMQYISSVYFDTYLSVKILGNSVYSYLCLYLFLNFFKKKGFAFSKENEIENSKIKKL
ncbi:hypothetical protein RFI_31836 [Reticulomyxa filosa]|uniref:Uncharacterized protein n=1 Tax=Reticulomyxa filosa TaxID=46433 RepID=X6LXU9_RETFI|nr:hypothetical protein RFI_31836 [Reticulomyxa filosa]|eukprot:ETO05560.1 hypothetical protein RFI_31836 [Reticulomyxa filosa]